MINSDLRLNRLAEAYETNPNLEDFAKNVKMLCKEVAKSDKNSSLNISDDLINSKKRIVY